MSLSSPQLIAISGGIGCGKSVVARMMKAMGYDVYDCDMRARQLMDESIPIRRAIASSIDRESIRPDGTINRQRLASVVFGNKEQLERLNSIVHGAVRDDINEWRERNATAKVLFVETAILYQSGIDSICDKVIEVVAPEDVRILRIRHRNGLSDSEIRQRIESQDIIIDHPHPATVKFDNSGNVPLIPQVLLFLDSVISR